MLKKWLPKVSGEKRTQMATIMAALALSPFRGLANAKTATGLDDVEAAFVAFSECPNRVLASRAANLLNVLTRNSGQAVAKLILGELRAGAGVYECKYHPNLLSWVQGLALDELILLVINQRISDVEEVRSLFPEILDKYIRSLEKWPVFGTISQY